MSKYTTEVRYICEMNSGFPVDEMQDHTPDEIISASRAKIFDFSYPIYESGHKPELETKILKHYYTREIGAETVGLWKLWLNDTLNLIMPKYNKLYKAEADILAKELKNVDVEHYTKREDDFTKDSDFTRTDNLHDVSDTTRTDNLSHGRNTTRTDNLSESSSGTTASADKYSDTPQGTVSNVDNNTYLTDYRKIDGTSSETTTNTGTQTTAEIGTDTGTQRNAGTVDHTGTQRNAGTDNNYGEQEISGWEKGYRGEKIYAALLADYADKVLNIDMMIVHELNKLFILLW